jgi:hypothetical protein
MSGLVKSVRHIQIKTISYHPKLFQAIIDYESHPTKFDESDDLEYQKQLMNDLCKHNWFMTPRGDEGAPHNLLLTNHWVKSLKSPKKDTYDSLSWTSAPEYF